MNAKITLGRIIAAVIFFIASIAGATWLLLFKWIGEVPFVILVGLSVGVSCLIVFYERIDSLKIRDFEIKFREVKESERLVKLLALKIVALVESIERHAITDEGFDQAAFDKAKDEIKKNAG